MILSVQPCRGYFQAQMVGKHYYHVVYNNDVTTIRNSLRELVLNYTSRLIISNSGERYYAKSQKPWSHVREYCYIDL